MLATRLRLSIRRFESLTAPLNLHILDTFLVVIVLHGLTERSLGEAFPAHLPVASWLEVMRLADWTQLHSLFSRVMALLTKRDATLQAYIALLRQRSSLSVMGHRGFHRGTMPNTERIHFQKGFLVALPFFRVPSGIHEGSYHEQRLCGENGEISSQTQKLSIQSTMTSAYGPIP